MAERRATVLLAPIALAFLAFGGAVAPTSAADLAYGEYLAAECVACHRDETDEGAIPSIAGLPAAYFINALRDYRAGRRANPVMRSLAGSLDDEQIAALAAYFASLKQRETAP